MTTDAALEEPGLIFDKPADLDPVEDDRLDLQLNTSRFVACLILNVAVFIIILAVISPFLGEYIRYSQETGFIGPEALFGGLLATAILMTFVSYQLLVYGAGTHAIGIFWAFILFSFFLIAWFIRIGIDLDDYFNGVQPNKYSTFINMACIVFALVLLYYAFRYKLIVGIAMLLVVIWLMFLLYNTWFSPGGTDNPI